jgi:hypothetical protein
MLEEIFMNRAAELLFCIIGVALLYYIISTRQAMFQKGMPMKGLRRNDV